MLRYALVLGAMAAVASVFGAPTVPTNVTDVATNLIVGGPGYLMELEVHIANNESKVANGNHLTQAGWIPSWAVKKGDRLYVVDEASATLSSYEFNLSTKALELKDMAKGSSGVVHLAINGAHTRLMGAAYGEGTIDVWDVNDATGRLKHLQSLSSNNSSKGSPTVPHPHQVVYEPHERFALVNDLGTDTILVIDTKDPNKFAVTNRIPVMPPGCGPRHGAFFPKYPEDIKKLGNLFYVVVCEKANLLAVYRVANETDKLCLHQVQVVSTYGPNSQPKDPKAAAAGGILLLPRGDEALGIADIYVTNRLTGHESDHIAHFAFNNGTVEFKDDVSTGGIAPRAIATVFGNTDVLVTNQRGEVGLAGFKRDPANGSLGPKAVLQVPRVFFDSTNTEAGPQFVMQVTHADLLNVGGFFPSAGTGVSTSGLAAPTGTATANTSGPPQGSQMTTASAAPAAGGVFTTTMVLGDH